MRQIHFPDWASELGNEKYHLFAAENKSQIEGKQAQGENFSRIEDVSRRAGND